MSTVLPNSSRFLSPHVDSHYGDSVRAIQAGTAWVPLSFHQAMEHFQAQRPKALAWRAAFGGGIGVVSVFLVFSLVRGLLPIAHTLHLSHRAAEIRFIASLGVIATLGAVWGICEVRYNGQRLAAYSKLLAYYFKVASYAKTQLDSIEIERLTNHLSSNYSLKMGEIRALVESLSGAFPAQGRDAE
jgi:hypothetical protein